MDDPVPKGCGWRFMLIIIVLISLPFVILADEPESTDMAPRVWLPFVQVPVVQPYVTPTFTPKPSPTPSPSPTPVPPPQNVLVNGHFDYANHTYAWWQNDLSIITNTGPGAWDGAYYAHAGVYNSTMHWIKNWWMMPYGYNAVRIIYHYRIKTTEPDPLRYDTAIVYLFNDDTGQMLATLDIFDNSNGDSGVWHESRIIVTNMQWWVGVVSIEILAETDVMYPTIFDFDGFDIYPINYYGMAENGFHIVEASRVEE
jgi:hypothetical protein